MKVFAEFGVGPWMVIGALIIALVSVSSAFQEGQFREFTLTAVDAVTEAAGTGAADERDEPGRARPLRPNQTRGKTPTSRSEPTAYRHDSSHCKNGGTGFLRTFCFCTAEFTGRYCEQRHNQTCGRLEHGEMVYQNCSYCRCLDGALQCRVHALAGCRDTAGAAPDRHLGNEIALSEVQHNSGTAPRGSLLGLVASLTFAGLIVDWLQSTPVR